MTGLAAVRVDNTRGATLLAAACVVLTAEVVLLRSLGNRVDFIDMVLFRALAQLVFSTVWVLVASGVAGMRTRRPGMHLLRGGLSLVCWWLYYASFSMLNLALATVLTFTTSLFVVALAGPLMGERVGALRAGATVVGFAGVVIASGLVSMSFDPAVLLGVTGALGSAGIVLLNRRLAATEATPTIMFYIGVVAVLGVGPALVLNPTLPAAEDALVLLVIGFAGCLGMWLTLEAYRSGEVSALAPVPYLRLVFAAAAGFLLFGETPAPTVWIGAALIIASALLVSIRRPQPGS